MRTLTGCLACLLLLTAPVAAEDTPSKPLNAQAAAAQAVALHEAKDRAGLKALAESGRPDPWRVADVLCHGGAHDVAAAFARLAPKKEVATLAAHIEARRKDEPHPELWDVLTKAQARVQADDAAGALALLVGVKADAAAPISVFLVSLRGTLRRQRKQLAEARAAFVEAARAAETMGWLRSAASNWTNAGTAARLSRDLRGALGLLEKGRALYEQIGHGEKVAGCMADIGLCHAQLGDMGRALKHWTALVAVLETGGNQAGMLHVFRNLVTLHEMRREFDLVLVLTARALPIAAALGDETSEAWQRAAAGNAHFARGDYDKALPHLERAVELAKTVPVTFDLPHALGLLGTVHSRAGDHERALPLMRRMVAAAKLAGRADRHAEGLMQVASQQSALGEHEEALTTVEAALRLARGTGEPAAIARTLGVNGNILFALGLRARALVVQEERRSLAKNAGLGSEEADALNDLGVVHFDHGSYDKALSFYGRARTLFEKLGRVADAARVLGNEAAIQSARGSYGLAFRDRERALALAKELASSGNFRGRVGYARALGDLGSLYHAVGEFKRARKYHEQALDAFEGVGDWRSYVNTLGNLGVVFKSLGLFSEARTAQERALELSTKHGLLSGEAAARANLADLYMRAGEKQRALAFQQAAVDLCVKLGNQRSLVHHVANLGRFQAAVGNYAAARRTGERSLTLARAIGDRRSELHALTNLAEVAYARRDDKRAVALLEDAAAIVPVLTGRLAEEQGATARDQFKDIAGLGFRAAQRLGDTGRAVAFVERGRAMGLLASLGGRESLGRASIDPELYREEQEQRRALAAARVQVDRARKRRTRSAIRSANKAVEAIEAKLLGVVERIQRAARVQADVTHPKAATLKEIQGSLAKGEALVEYAIASGEVFGIVLTPKRARIVALGGLHAIQAAAASLAELDADSSPTDSIRQLRALVVSPLKLEAGVTRLLISPVDDLAYVPFALLTGERSIAYVPSGTTYVHLRHDAARRGRRVLALGDPEYGPAPRAGRHGGSRGGALLRLPATRAEVKAIGDVVLLGAKATEGGLREALRGEERWQAVHLACHGLVDGARPMLSSLAVTPSAEDDGFFTTMEVFRTRVVADLVVLSACETAHGKVFRTEGVVGFTRAFMFAGSPRVIVSLWKVDDKATRALMVKFYELWKPGTIDTAEALRQAQAHVRSQKRWAHPVYWAAWQLWGLGN